MQKLPITRVATDPAAEPLPARQWPMTLPCVQDLLAAGLELGPLTVLVGENGSGKSTLVEAIAGRYGLSPEGGSTGARHSTRPTESPLSGQLLLRRGIGASRWGFFLRAETMHGFYTYLEANSSGRDSNFHEMSHGEGFVAILESRFDGPGFYALDEPESALSFTGCLALVSVLSRMAAGDSAQALVATHSPIIAATPGAKIIEVGEWGLRERQWEELELVANWRAFLQEPEMFLRYLRD